MPDHCRGGQKAGERQKACLRNSQENRAPILAGHPLRGLASRAGDGDAVE
jgi:hypothetical protein